MVRLSKQKERSMNNLIREAVRQYLERETKG
ncbi:ribbon-helix-helix protein, CopG family [Tolypothrix campylonemoides VB511288]|nr:ribbon-helix-helix protein, CopG family [Tolypothrix campylonemoides VB511288]